MKNVIDALLDSNNMDDVSLFVDGKQIMFEQIANIECEGELYCFLVPKEKMEGVEEDEGVLFQFVTVDGKTEITMVKDDQTIDRVYQEYLNLLG